MIVNVQIIKFVQEKDFVVNAKETEIVKMEWNAQIVTNVLNVKIIEIAHQEMSATLKINVLNVLMMITAMVDSVFKAVVLNVKRRPLYQIFKDSLVSLHQ